MFVVEPLLLVLLAAAASFAAWRVPKLGRDWRWSSAARALGLVVSGDCRAWGQLDGHEVGIRWSDGPRATFWVGGTGSLERLAEVRTRLDSRWPTTDDPGRIGLAALESLAGTGHLAFEIDARPGDEERLIEAVARVAVWVADELGWRDDTLEAELGAAPPDGPTEEAKQRLAERLTELRARAPSGVLRRPPDVPVGSNPTAR